MPRQTKAGQYEGRLRVGSRFQATKMFRTRQIRSRMPRIQKFKLRGSFGMSSNASGEIVGVYSNDPSGYADWTGLLTLYDAYKVTGIKMHYIPTLPNDTSTVTGYWPLYMACDQNDTSTPATVGQLLDYNDMVVKNMYKPWKIYRKIYDQSAISGQTILSGGYRPITVTTGSAGIKYFGNGFDVNTTYGQVIITVYLKCKLRR